MKQLRQRIAMIVPLLAIAAWTGCSMFQATPTECIEAAENAGVPDSAIEKLKSPGDLGPIERAALQRTLRQAGVSEACETSELMPNRDDRGDGDDDEKRAEQEQAEPTAYQDRGVNQQGPRIAANEYQRRCKFWARENLSPVVYAEFSDVRVNEMDDLDRIFWKSVLHGNQRYGYYEPTGTETEQAWLMPRDPGIYCRDYWAEPLNRDNAELRNHAFENECRDDLNEAIINQYRRLKSWATSEDSEDFVYDTPNQYVRILQWLDLTGEELVDSDDPPYRILEEQSRHQYAHWVEWQPTEENLEEYREEHGVKVDLEWIGIAKAAGLSRNETSAMNSCLRYYPQLFYGYWIPIDPDTAPQANLDDDRPRARYHPEMTPIYLPDTVTAERIPEGYPLGKKGERHYLCGDRSDETGYYYIQHPLGNYCEAEP